MAVFQFIRANSDKLDAQSLKTSLLCWNDFSRTNPLASQKLVHETQARLFIEDDLSWTYQFTVTGEPIALDVSKLLSTVHDLEQLLYRYRYNTPDGLPRDLEQAVLDGSSTAIAVKTEGSVTLSTRILIQKLIGDANAPLEPFLHISTENIRDMGNILALLDNQSIAVKGRMDELKKGETTTEKRFQVATLLEIDSLHSSAEIQTLRLVHQVVTMKGDLGMHFDQIKRLGKKRGDYFFLNLEANF
jgi:hypothetical protein